jgi:IclR family acetate operon transcriptional repressor
MYMLAGIDRAVAILDACGTTPAPSLVEIARSAGLSDATASRYLTSLAAHGLIERDEATRRYRLGLRLFQLGQRALSGRDPRAVALPFMERLLERFGETVNLAMRHADELILIEALESTRSIKKGATVGDRDHWHASSLGKAILAALPKDEARRLAAKCERARYTPRTITDVDELLAHLASVRERGYAVDDEESEAELCCVGIAILDRRGAPSYALSIAGPASRFGLRLIEEIGVELKATAEMISRDLGHASASDGAPPSHDA